LSKPQNEFSSGMNFSIGMNLQLVFQLVSLKSIFKLVSISKTLLKAKASIHAGGAFIVKGKAFETGGLISNLKNASCNHILIPLTI
jgi:hypothetical protein